MKHLLLPAFFFIIIPFIIDGGIVELGPCLLHYLEPCTNETIQFYLFSSLKPRDPPVLLDVDNPIVPTFVNLSHTMKLLVHGFAGHLDFNATRSIRNGKCMGLLLELNFKLNDSLPFEG